MNPKLSVIVISYNTREMTLECLRSVFHETKNTSFELIVLDNASSDASAEAIANEFDGRINLIVSSENLGFALGNNQAALEAKGEYLLLLNPDTVVLDGAIDRLVDFAESKPKAGIWGGKTLFGDKSIDPTSCWAKQTPWSLLCQATGLSSIFRRTNLFNPEGIGGWNREGMHTVDIVTGCFLLIRLELWKKLGGFNTDFFMYGEEADLCLRAHKLGAQPIVSSRATIIHYGGASEKIRADKMVRLLTAKMRLIQYHFPWYSKKIGYVLLFLWPLSRFIILVIIDIIKRDGAFRKSAIWREVIQRRDEWAMQLGYLSKVRR